MGETAVRTGRIQLRRDFWGWRWRRHYLGGKVLTLSPFLITSSLALVGLSPSRSVGTITVSSTTGFFMFLLRVTKYWEHELLRLCHLLCSQHWPRLYGKFFINSALTHEDDDGVMVLLIHFSASIFSSQWTLFTLISLSLHNLVPRQRLWTSLLFPKMTSLFMCLGTLATTWDFYSPVPFTCVFK